MYAKIQTKSNYRNLNGQFVKVKQFLGTLVYCETEISNETITFDVSLSEVTEIRENLPQR
jgi:hypothetical protein